MNVFKPLLDMLPIKTAYAHCDIPCGIYDPYPAQIAAHTVIRMTQLISEVKKDDAVKMTHDISRMAHVKEEHAGAVEEELGTLQNDYFKPEHYEANPKLTELLNSTVKLSGKVRQGVDMESANALLENVLKISEIFYKTKNLEPVRIPSGYPTAGELVTHK